jgi:hypothetical protein
MTSSKSGCEFKMVPHVRRTSVVEHSQGHSTAQETNLFREFTRQVRSGRLNQAWPEYAIKTQTVMDACLSSAHHGSAALSAMASRGVLKSADARRLD